MLNNFPLRNSTKLFALNQPSYTITATLKSCLRPSVCTEVKSKMFTYSIGGHATGSYRRRAMRIDIREAFVNSQHATQQS
jgi:hypothetical protein